jgi:predicted GIY-YIG superfamily endonuclease
LKNHSEVDIAFFFATMGATGRYGSMDGTHVYMLRSQRTHGKTYIGLTRDLELRLAEHNRGQTATTAPDRPWRLVTAIWFCDRDRAEAFERYLERGSGHAFAKKHFW